MIDWTSRAKAAFSDAVTPATAKTDETHLLSVSSAPTGAAFEFPQKVSSVSSVAVMAIFDNHGLADDLMEAAMRVCDRWNDLPAAREQMRQDVLNTPAHLGQDLLDHLLGKPTTAPATLLIKQPENNDD